MHCFLALPLKRMAVEPLWLDEFFEALALFRQAMDAFERARTSDEAHGVCSGTNRPALMPEIDLDAYTTDRLGTAWCRGLAVRLEDNGLECGVHLPFNDLHPASLDERILLGTRESLERALEFASLLSPSHLIAHSGYDPGQHAEDEYEEFLGRSKETWLELLGRWPNHPPLFIENTFEQNPEPLRDLVTILHTKRVGICFDAGHWNSFSGGSRRQDLHRWLKALAPYIGHLHLHDNDGSADQHRGLGTGNIPWDQLIGGLRCIGITPGITLEPHSRDALRQSMEYMGSRRDLFEAMLCRPAPQWGRRRGGGFRASS